MAADPKSPLRCPTCEIHVMPNAAPEWLPFCSERCKLVDLGRWLNEEHALPCESLNEDEEAEEMDLNTPKSPRLPPGWHDA